MNDWIQLPDVEPHQINAARGMVRLLTGNLNAKIDSNPVFPGKERHLLRAQLARIQHSCELCIKDEYTIEENEETEAKEIKPSEDFSVPATDELKSLESWVYKNPIILKAGRCTHFEPKGMEEEDLQAHMEKLAEEDQAKEPFTSIAEDEQPKNAQAWLSSVSGDEQPYKKIGGDEGTISYAVNVLRSYRWPGATTISKNG